MRPSRDTEFGVTELKGRERGMKPGSEVCLGDGPIQLLDSLSPTIAKGTV